MVMLYIIHKNRLNQSIKIQCIIMYRMCLKYRIMITEVATVEVVAVRKSMTKGKSKTW